MIRTQIYLPEHLHKQLTQQAKQRKTSLAGIIREFIGVGLKGRAVDDYSGKEAMKAIAQLNFKGAPHDLSTNHDSYLYDEPYGNADE